MKQLESSSGLSWQQAAFLASPTIAMLVAGLLVGITTIPGIVLIVSALCYLTADLAFIQPWLAREHSERYGVLRDIAPWYYHQLALCSSAAELADLVSRTNQLLTGSPRALLIVSGTGPMPAIYGGTAADVEVVRLAPEQVAWFGAERHATNRFQVQDGSAPAQFLDYLDCQIAIPLWDSGVAVGLIVAQTGRLTPPIEHVYRWLSATTGPALARLALEFDMHKASQLVSIVDYTRATQEALMPDDKLIESDGIRIQGISLPAAQCGGDLWAWRSLGHGRVLIFIGDVTGHGVAPALLSATAAGCIHANAFAAGAALDPAALLGDVNRSLYRVARASYMMTAFAAIIDYTAGEIRYANAAQNFPFVMTFDVSGECKLVSLIARGPMLGYQPEVSFETCVHSFQPGNKLVMYTDGIVEAENPKGRSFGERRLRTRLQEIATRKVNEIAAGVLEDVHGFVNGRPPVDDITIVVIERPLDHDNDARGS